MPSHDRIASADWVTLTPDEEVRWVGRPTIYTIAPALVASALAVIFGVIVVVALPSLVGESPNRALYIIPLALIVAGLAVGSLTYLRWIRLLYVITTEEIYIKRGLVSRDVSQIRLSRVQNTTFNQSIIERALSFGDITIYTAGTDTMNIELENVPDPDRINGILTTLLSNEDTRPRNRV
ncbi:PH domain-containing protein [Haloferacaceae archaeon DSL9]